MRRFYSYGPVDSERHFCVERRELREKCFKNLTDDPEKGGHFFTMWAPRQAGKTWLLWQVREEIEKQHKDRFIIGSMSMQGTVFREGDTEDAMLPKIPFLMKETFQIKPEAPEDWDEWKAFFSKNGGLFDRPVILFIDEFDSLPPKVIDRLVTLFRDMYLKRDEYLLHGLALIGVRAVLGVESERGSPFNVQRSLQVPNFTPDEVGELFRQYAGESGQKILQEVVDKVYEATRGQPGLVCWFGELLTEKFNPGEGKTIDLLIWKRAYGSALRREWNNTVLNLVKKARSEKYQPYVMELFASSDIPFNIDAEWCNYLYLNGIIDTETSADDKGEHADICRFSSPFVQERLYNALTYDLMGDRLPILALEILDELEDVFGGDSLNLPALLRRYKDYLKRLRAKGLNPWKGQPRRADIHYTEAVGHFHLYAWLRSAVGRRCIVSPEFPTGNGRVDLHLRRGEQRGIIEVKSFVDASEVRKSRKQAAEYAGRLNMDSVTVALFVPTEDEEILGQLSGGQTIDGVSVTVVAIGWAI